MGTARANSASRSETGRAVRTRRTKQDLRAGLPYHETPTLRRGEIGVAAYGKCCYVGGDRTDPAALHEWAERVALWSEEVMGNAAKLLVLGEPAQFASAACRSALGVGSPERPVRAYVPCLALAAVPDAALGTSGQRAWRLLLAGLVDLDRTTWALRDGGGADVRTWLATTISALIANGAIEVRYISDDRTFAALWHGDMAMPVHEEPPIWMPAEE